MFKILTMHNGCKSAFGITNDLVDDLVDPNEEVRLYNQAREICIMKYFEVRKQCLVDKKEEAGEDNDIDFGEIKILDQLKGDEEIITDAKYS